MTIFGIDLGTTYSCIAQIDDTGRPVVIKNAIGEDSTPSVVFFETPENVVVGREAKNSARVYPDLVVSLIKRRMGEDHAELEFHGVVQTPVSISALILQELARAAQQIGHVPVRDVVITVPAYFGVKEREATRAAGDVAGLNVLNVVPEPVAAALHYDAFGSAGGERTILVYDLGGGTFDTTVIKISDREVTVVCTDGDHHLGGADWDERIADLLLQRFLKDHPDSDAGDSDEFLQELAVAAEDVKRALSSLESRRQNMRWNGASSRLELSRQEFENATADLLERTHDITLRTVTTAREKGVERFDDVLLVGGSTRMPAVAGMLRSRFGFEPKIHDPDLAVAKGAALFALIESVRIALPGSAADGEATPAVLAEAAADLGIDVDSMKQLAGKRVTAVVPRAFGVKVLARDDTNADPDGFIVDHLLRANSPLPAEPPAQTYGTAYEGMVGITLEIWEQAGAAESARLTDNAKIGEGRIEDLPPMPANSPVEVTFAMDEMGTLRVHAVERRTDKELLMQLAISGLSQDRLDEARSAVAKYAVGA